MAKTINITLDNKSISDAIKELKAYSIEIKSKEKELRKKLADIGMRVASVTLKSATYDGTNDVEVRVDEGATTATIYAEGKAVAFIEFGTGIKYGYGHPQAGEFGFGPGTWSDGPEGKGHWDDPNGWYYAHAAKSHGNPPSMGMYKAVQEITEKVTEIAREVFSQ